MSGAEIARLPFGMRIFTYKGHPDASLNPLGLHRYPSRIGWYLTLPGKPRRFICLHLDSRMRKLRERNQLGQP